VFQHRTDSQRARNQFLQREMTRLDADLQGMARLQMESDALRERRGILEHLQHQRKLPVHLLQELALQIPEGVYLNSLRQVRQSILLTGLAPSQERVTELLHNLNSSDWLSQPELVEIAAIRADQPEGDPVRRTRFTISVTWGPESRHVGVQQGVPSVVHQRP
jgi:type IV pilus assembly protein PilN